MRRALPVQTQIRDGPARETVERRHPRPAGEGAMLPPKRPDPISRRATRSWIASSARSPVRIRRGAIRDRLEVMTPPQDAASPLRGKTTRLTRRAVANAQHRPRPQPRNAGLRNGNGNGNDLPPLREPTTRVGNGNARGHRVARGPSPVPSPAPSPAPNPLPREARRTTRRRADGLAPRADNPPALNFALPNPAVLK